MRTQRVELANAPVSALLFTLPLPGCVFGRIRSLSYRRINPARSIAANSFFTSVDCLLNAIDA
jgi:hypothetical protein